MCAFVKMGPNKSLFHPRLRRFPLETRLFFSAQSQNAFVIIETVTESQTRFVLFNPFIDWAMRINAKRNFSFVKKNWQFTACSGIVVDRWRSISSAKQREAQLLLRIWCGVKAIICCVVPCRAKQNICWFWLLKEDRFSVLRSHFVIDPNTDDYELVSVRVCRTEKGTMTQKKPRKIDAIGNRCAMPFSALHQIDNVLFFPYKPFSVWPEVGCQHIAFYKHSQRKFQHGRKNTRTQLLSGTS